jgi:hypothetical protein
VIVRNSKVTVKRTPPSTNGRKLSLTVVSRQQAPEEQRRFRAATNALLTELVRQQMGRGDSKNE